MSAPVIVDRATARTGGGWQRLTRGLAQGVARGAALRVSSGTAYCLVVYLVTRLAVAMGVTAAYLSGLMLSWKHFLFRDDAWWYERIAQHGYGRTLQQFFPTGSIHSHGSTWAFFPGYPLLIRGLHDATRIPYGISAFLLALVLAFVAIRAVYALGESYGGVAVARSSAVLVAVWPGSAAMNLPYSEGLFLAATAGSLLAIRRRRWWLAGGLGFVATLTRAIGVALVVAALAVAVREVWTRRDYLSIVTPVLAGAGIGAFYVYGWWVTGDPLIWRHAENLWHQHIDWGAELRRRIGHVATIRGERGVEGLLIILGLVMIVFMVTAGIALRRRADLALSVYTVVALFMILAYSGVGSRPRMVLAVIPGFLWLARWLRPRAAEILTIGLGAMLAMVAYLYLGLAVP